MQIFPRSLVYIIMGNLRCRISLVRFMNRLYKKSHLSLKLPKMLLWKLEPFIWFVFVDKDIGPPTSIGESDLDGVGLVVEF